MISAVTVQPDKNGNVITLSVNNPEWGYVRLVQDTPLFHKNSIMEVKSVSALLVAKLVDLEKMQYHAGQELPGQIVIEEAHSPFQENDSDRHLKRAGDSGVLCRVDDQPIYRRTYYTKDMSIEHTLIAHSNSEEIREANRERSAVQVTATSRKDNYERIVL